MLGNGSSCSRLPPRTQASSPTLPLRMVAAVDGKPFGVSATATPGMAKPPQPRTVRAITVLTPTESDSLTCSRPSGLFGPCQRGDNLLHRVSTRRAGTTCRSTELGPQRMAHREHVHHIRDIRSVKISTKSAPAPYAPVMATLRNTSFGYHSHQRRGQSGATRRANRRPHDLTIAVTSAYPTGQRGLSGTECGVFRVWPLGMIGVVRWCSGRRRRGSGR